MKLDLLVRMVSLDMNGRIIMLENFEDVIDTLRNKSRTHGEINIRIMGFKAQTLGIVDHLFCKLTYLESVLELMKVERHLSQL